MKNIYSLLLTFVITTLSLAQAPQTMSYQAVVRDASGNLITEQEIGMKISILQGSVFGASVYIETQSTVTNENGLVSIAIGGGVVVHGPFSAIDWADGPYFIKTETDPSGGTTYTISGTSQLLTVPYALHAKTAETISEPIVESDPVFEVSPAAGIEAADISNWDAAYLWGDHAIEGYLTEETDPLFTSWDKSTGIEINESQISDLQDYLTDYTVTEEDVTGHQVALEITESQITNLQNYLLDITGEQIDDLSNVDLTGLVAGNILKYDETEGNWIVTEPSDLETDPVFEASPAAGIVAADIGTWDEAYSWGDHAEEGYLTEEPPGTTPGEIKYWNGSAWLTVAPGTTGQVLTFTGGVPTWATTVGVGDVENPTTGKIWMDRNLGASQAANSSTDGYAYGDLFQWGRSADGHQIRTSETNSTLSNSNTPGHGYFILSLSSPYDWRSPQEDNLWQGVNGINNPCPSGYRLPTEAEWEEERLSWSSNNSAGAFGSPLKLPVAGRRRYSNGSLLGVGSDGLYWSSTVDGAYSRILIFSSSNALMSSYTRASGVSVRCLKD